MTLSSCIKMLARAASYCRTDHKYDVFRSIFFSPCAAFTHTFALGPAVLFQCFIEVFASLLLLLLVFRFMGLDCCFFLMCVYGF